MKALLIFSFIFISSFFSFAQEFTGEWKGVLKVQGTQLRLVFNVTSTENGYVSTMDSPDQGVKGIPVTKTTVEKSTITFEISNAGIEYRGDLILEEIEGTFKQGGQEFPLNLSKAGAEIEEVRRPQEPVKPYPYSSEEVTFENRNAGISLSGTLTLPKKEGVFPAVVLISGSGPQNRNEEILGHKPFLVISDYLTRNGIAVLRFDDRGVGKSTGDFGAATTADFATDVESAIAYLKTRKEINKKKIGLIGHSEGGIIAPMVASSSKDVNFIVLLAGTGIIGSDLLLLQQALIARSEGVSEEDISKSIENNKLLFELIVNSKDDSKLKVDLTNKLNEILDKDTSLTIPDGTSKDEFISMQLNEILEPWMLYFLKFDPQLTLEKVKCPVFALNGEKDLQVPPNENLSAIKSALIRGGNKNVTTKEYPNLNHLFQESETGSPSEYFEIQQTIAPVVLEDISTWIKLQVN